MLLSTVRLSFLLPPIVRHFRRPVLSIPSVISRGAELFALEIISPPVACAESRRSIRPIGSYRSRGDHRFLPALLSEHRTAVSVSLLLEKIGEEKCVFRGFSVEKGGRASVGAWLLNMVA